MSQIICPITGEILLRSDLLLGMDFRSIHPFLQAKKEIILGPNIIYQFIASKNIREKKIFYLAALNVSDLVEFRCAANPDAWIMESTFVQLMELVHWTDYIRGRMMERIKFPRYVVDRENADLKNISIWLGEINEIKNLFLKKSVQEDLKRELSAKAADIEREFKRARAYGQAFTIPLAKWALDFAEVEEGMYAIWLKFLTTPLEDAWTLNVKDLEEMLIHFQCELPITNDQVIAVLNHTKLLISKCMEGYGDFVFIDENDDEGGDAGGAVTVTNNNPRKPNGNAAQEEQLIRLEDIGPEPLRHQFNKSFLYLQAKARYDLLVREATGKGSSRGEFKTF